MWCDHTAIYISTTFCLASLASPQSTEAIFIRTYAVVLTKLPDQTPHKYCFVTVQSAQGRGKY